MSSDWYWETDIDGRYRHLSEGITTLTGLTAEECLGKLPWESLDDTADNTSWVEYQRCIDARETFRDIEVQFDTLSEEPVYFLLSGEPYFGLHGEYQGYHGVARNITPRRRSEQQHLEALKLTESLIELALRRAQYHTAPAQRTAASGGAEAHRIADRAGADAAVHQG